MIARPRFTFASGQICAEGPGIGGIQGESRQVLVKDTDLLSKWVSDYKMALNAGSRPETLLALGRELYDWLDGDQEWMRAVVSAHGREGEGPLVIELATGSRPDDHARLFLEAPWELLADGDGHLALREPGFCPARRIGTPAKPPEPDRSRLSAVFMAAQPRNTESKLSYEVEEDAILTATQGLGMALTVEESGAPGLLARTVAEERPDLVHISCHGGNEPGPVLILEDEKGGRDDATPETLSRAMGRRPPRLVFLSACLTAAPKTGTELVGSFASDMIGRGIPAVLGWGGSVGDAEATRFAGWFYENLARGETAETAAAFARFWLAVPESGSEAESGLEAESGSEAESGPGDGHVPAAPGRFAPPLKRRFPFEGGPESADWHMARLYLGPSGGGALRKPGAAVEHSGPPEPKRAFLDERRQKNPVASRREFVGRRRQIQKILQVFDDENYAGVLIHGFARQGKSSLAARVAHRLANRTPSLKTAVVYGNKDPQGHPLEPDVYLAPGIFGAVADALGTEREEVQAVAQRYRDRLQNEPEALRDALLELMEFGGVDPFLLVVDDLEQVLTPPSEGKIHRVSRQYQPALRAVVEAFESPRSRTPCRLLFTGRHRFALRSATGEGLEEQIFDVHLPSMKKYEQRKQAAAKVRAAGPFAADLQQTDRCIELSRGNPGLQDLLFALARENQAACDRALDQMETYLADGTSPDKGKLLDFFNTVALDALLGLLSETEKDLLRASSLFRLPVPEEIFRILAGEKYRARLTAIGLWDRYEDLVDPDVPAVALNPLVLPRTEGMAGDEAEALAGAMLPELFRLWGGAGQARPRVVDTELARLGVMVGNAEVLAAVGHNAVRDLEDSFLYAQASDLAMQSIAIIEEEKKAVPVWLYLYANQVCFQIGKIEEARRFIESAVQTLRTDGKIRDGESAYDLGSALLRHGRMLAQSGSLSEALSAFEEARELFVSGSRLRDKAIALGDIARIRVDKGEVEEALKLHEERLGVFESLGDRRERAVTLGDIARIRVDKGEVEEALKLHEEMLGVFESLGDRRSRAVTLGDIARIRVDKGEVEEALKLHEERLGVFESLGDRRSRAVTLGDIARIRVDKGEVEEALKLHEEMLGVFESLGDRRSRAVTLGDIARIRVDKGEVEEALKLHEERLGVFESLGDRRSRAVTLGDIARIRVDKGEVEEALKLHEERLGVFESLGDRRERAVTLGDIARIRVSKGEVEEALKLHEEMLGVFESLGDRRSRAVTLGDIARIRVSKGEVEEALKLHEEMLGVFESLGDRRSRAVTLGDIARIRVDKGEVEEALKLHEEELRVYESLGDRRSRAVTLWDMGKIAKMRGEKQKALGRIGESYEIVKELRDAGGLSTVGEVYGGMLAESGNLEYGLEVLELARQVYAMLGQPQNAERVKSLIARLGQDVRE